MHVLKAILSKKDNFVQVHSLVSIVTCSPPVFNPPSITSSTSTLDITEGNDTTLTCTRDPSNSQGDQYRWVPPGGSFDITAKNSPVMQELSTINRNQSGVYTCYGSRTDTNATVSTNITVNVQCELHCDK